MTKPLIKFGVGAGMAIAFMLPLAVFASANLTFLTVDGATNATVSEGSSIDAKVTLNTSASTHVESMSWELVGSNLPQTCIDTSDISSSGGTFTRSFDIDTTGATEGTWDVRIRAYGNDGASVSNLCETSDQVDSMNFPNRITVTDSNNDNQTGGTSGSQPPSWLAALIAALRPSTPTPPASSSACAVLATKLLGTQDFVYNNANVVLQGYLLSEGMSIPALAAGASFGYKGTQTNAALSMYKSSKGCI